MEEVRTMKHRACTLAAVAAAAGLLIAGAGASPSTFTDPAGDSGAAPDVTAVAVSDASRALTIVVTAAGLTPGQSVDVYLNTDKNESTGSPTGSEFDVEIWQEDGSWGW